MFDVCSAIPLGMSAPLIISSVSLFTFRTVLPPGQASQLSCLAWGVFQTFQPQLPPLRLVAWGRRGLTLCPQGPQGGPPHRFLSCHNEAAGGCGRKSEVNHCFRKDVSSGAHNGVRGRGPPRGVHPASRPAHIQAPLPAGILTLDDKALSVNMLLICNFENKIETSCIFKYKMKCDALYTI